MTFLLGAKSRSKLVLVRKPLPETVELAIKLSTQDFLVHQGPRTVAEQEAMVAAGTSRTMNSKHLLGADGYCEAVDLVPYKDGKAVWEWELIYPIAEAMRSACRTTGARIRWGGFWSDLGRSCSPCSVLVKEYVAYRRAQHLDAFIDGPHFELI